MQICFRSFDLNVWYICTHTQTDRLTYVHTYAFCNAVTLVWGPLRSPQLRGDTGYIRKYTSLTSKLGMAMWVVVLVPHTQHLDYFHNIPHPACCDVLGILLWRCCHCIMCEILSVSHSASDNTCIWTNIEKKSRKCIRTRISTFN